MSGGGRDFPTNPASSPLARPSNEILWRSAHADAGVEFANEIHLGDLPLSNTALALERFGVSRASSTIHNWVQNAISSREASVIRATSPSMEQSSKSAASNFD
jgi:hypothetical protein